MLLLRNFLHFLRILFSSLSDENPFEDDASLRQKREKKDGGKDKILGSNEEMDLIYDW